MQLVPNRLLDRTGDIRRRAEQLETRGYVQKRLIQGKGLDLRGIALKNCVDLLRNLRIQAMARRQQDGSTRLRGVSS